MCSVTWKTCIVGWLWCRAAFSSTITIRPSLLASFSFSMGNPSQSEAWTQGNFGHYRAYCKTDRQGPQQRTDKNGAPISWTKLLCPTLSKLPVVAIWWVGWWHVDDNTVKQVGEDEERNCRFWGTSSSFTSSLQDTEGLRDAQLLLWGIFAGSISCFMSQTYLRCSACWLHVDSIQFYHPHGWHLLWKDLLLNKRVQAHCFVFQLTFWLK